jgi:hypothetical protein
MKTRRLYERTNALCHSERSRGIFGDGAEIQAEDSSTSLGMTGRACTPNQRHSFDVSKEIF